MKKHCQSCGMPIEQDPKGGGTEKDGTHSTKWCSFCYEHGGFIDPDCTVDKMTNIVSELTRKMKLPEAHRKIAIAAVPKLERWKNT